MPFATVVDGITADTLVEWASVVKDLVLYLLACILMLGVDEATNQLEQVGFPVCEVICAAAGKY